MEWRCRVVDVSSFVRKRCEVETGNVPSVELRGVRKFVMGWIGSGPFRNSEKSRPPVSPGLIVIICCASVVDRDHKLYIIRRRPHG